VCNKCKDEYPEKYSLLTKTECKEVRFYLPRPLSLLTGNQDYLLTDRKLSIQSHDAERLLTGVAELRDRELLPHLLKANPHKSTFANMMLYLRCQVEDFAWKKWGSPEALDAEWERRTEEKKNKKNKKFEQGLLDLRRRTREGVWQRRRDQEHKHAFGVTEVIGDGMGRQICHECGFTIDVEVF